MNLSSCSAVVKKRAICPWSALYANTAPSPGVHIQKRTLSVLNPFSVVRRALFVTITVVPVALMQSHLSHKSKAFAIERTLATAERNCLLVLN